MEDLTSWVTKEAQNMGVDFACLSQQTRNNIISILMSGLENGFRSRMDSPDLRFAKRRGIGKESSGSILLDHSMVNNQPTCPTNPSIDNTCTNPSQQHPTCTDGNCIDNGCTNYISCGDNACDDNGCQNKPDANCTNTNCMDNQCRNNDCTDDRDTCIDDLDCIDGTEGSCSDLGTYTQKCLDTNTCSNFNCSDENCQDSNCSNSGCTDTGISSSTIPVDCIDSSCSNQSCLDSVENLKCFDNTCSNNYECTDMNNCEDNSCVNSVDCADNMQLAVSCGVDSTCKNDDCFDGGMKSNSKCLDSGCTNETCEDETSCKDNSCFNTVGCLDDDCQDGGSEECFDGLCINSSCTDVVQCEDKGCINCERPQHTCSDSGANFCKDTACFNYGQGCSDDTKCLDNVCRNWVSTRCTNSNTCTDTLCTDFPVCVDSSACNDGSDRQSCSSIFDMGGAAACADEKEKCWDQDCVDGEYQKSCSNEESHHCIDFNKGMSGCVDQVGGSSQACANSTNCIDYVEGATGKNCVDLYCINTTNCADRNECLDDHCENQTLCTDDSKCGSDDVCTNTYCSDIGTYNDPCTPSTTGSDTSCLRSEIDEINCVDNGCIHPPVNSSPSSCVDYTGCGDGPNCT